MCFQFVTHFVKVKALFIFGLIPHNMVFHIIFTKCRILVLLFTIYLIYKVVAIYVFVNLENTFVFYMYICLIFDIFLCLSNLSITCHVNSLSIDMQKEFKCDPIVIIKPLIRINGVVQCRSLTLVMMGGGGLMCPPQCVFIFFTKNLFLKLPIK